MKAYDTSVLVAKLKARGLDIAEDAARMIVEETLAWVTESAKVSETPFDDMLQAVIPLLQKSVLEQVDKIDGAQG